MVEKHSLKWNWFLKELIISNDVTKAIGSILEHEIKLMDN